GWSAGSWPAVGPWPPTAPRAASIDRARALPAVHPLRNVLARRHGQRRAGAGAVVPAMPGRPVAALPAARTASAAAAAGAAPAGRHRHGRAAPPIRVAVQPPPAGTGPA